MAGGGRSAFTQDEDDCLVKYIAKYNPQPSGRQGNRLYITLVENAGKKWNWAKAHTWQSWRARYTKNQDEFDRRIRRHMQKKAAAALEKEFPSQPVKGKDVPSKTKRENDNSDRKPVIDSSTNHAPSKAKGKQVENDENSRQSTSSSRRDVPVEAAKKKRTETDHDDTRRITPKPAKDLGEEVPQRPRIVDTNGYTAPSANFSKAGEPVEAIRTPIEDTESPVEPLEDDLMQELFGSYVEDGPEEEAEELVPDSQADDEESEPNSAVQSIYPKLPLSPIADEPHVPGAFEAAAYELPSPPRPASTAESPESPPARPAPKKLKPKLRKPVREDPFGTPSESTPPPRPLQGLARAGPLPVLVENGFRTALKRPRRSSLSDADATPWPPKRARTNVGVAHSKGFDEEATRRMDVDAVVPGGARQAQPNQPEHAPPPRRPVQVNAVASSSKTKLPSPASTDYQPKQPIFLHPSTKVMDVENPRPIVSHKTPVVKATASETKIYATSAKPPQPVLRTSSAHALPVGALSDNDPFTVKAVSEKDKGKARADFAIKDKQPIRIDLHKQSLQRRLTTNSLSLSANRSGSISRASSSSSGSKRKRRSGGGDTSTSLRKSLVGIGPADPKFELVVAAVEDITQTLAQMAAAYGVVEKLAHATYIKTKSLEKTKFVLQQLGNAMAEKEKAIYAAMPELASGSVSGAEDAEDSDEEVPGGLVLRPGIEIKDTQQRTEKRKDSKSPTRSSGRPSLSIRPVLDEEDRTFSEYQPPSISHASRFARLMKQGRVEEAVEREKRRVSGLFVQLTQDLKQSSPPSAVSPTPKPYSRNFRMEIDNEEEGEPIANDAAIDAEVAPEDDADDIYVRDDEVDRQADDESDHQDEIQQDTSPPYPSINALIKRLSGGHHKAPEFLAIAHRHHELALGAETQDVEELREFEETHDSSMLRLWSVKWAKEMLRGFQRVEEETLEDQADDA